MNSQNTPNRGGCQPLYKSRETEGNISLALKILYCKLTLRGEEGRLGFSIFCLLLFYFSIMSAYFGWLCGKSMHPSCFESFYFEFYWFLGKRNHGFCCTLMEDGDVQWVYKRWIHCTCVVYVMIYFCMKFSLYACFT